MVKETQTYKHLQVLFARRERGWNLHKPTRWKAKKLYDSPSPVKQNMGQFSDTELWAMLLKDKGMLLTYVILFRSIQIAIYQNQ